MLSIRKRISLASFCGLRKPNSKNPIARRYDTWLINQSDHSAPFTYCKLPMSAPALWLCCLRDLHSSDSNCGPASDQRPVSAWGAAAPRRSNRCLAYPAGFPPCAHTWRMPMVVVACAVRPWDASSSWCTLPTHVWTLAALAGSAGNVKETRTLVVAALSHMTMKT